MSQSAEDILQHVDDKCAGVKDIVLKRWRGDVVCYGADLFL